MFLRHTRFFAAVSVLLLSIASTAGAVVLWDQSNWNTLNEGSLNLASTSCSQLSGNTKLHTANDVQFNGAVTITTIRIYETLGNVQTATSAYLWIAPKTGPVPTQCASVVNNAANIVPITTTTVTNGSVTAVEVTASGLNIALPPGNYWVSLTPRHSRGIFPYTVHLVTSGAVLGDKTVSIDACNLANCSWVQVLPTPYDYAIKIEGDQVTPTSKQSWGRLKSIYR